MVTKSVVGQLDEPEEAGLIREPATSRVLRAIISLGALQPRQGRRGIYSMEKLAARTPSR